MISDSVNMYMPLKLTLRAYTHNVKCVLITVSVAVLTVAGERVAGSYSVLIIRIIPVNGNL